MARGTLARVLIVVRNNAREPKYRCLCCNDGVYFEGEEGAFHRHVVKCSARNDEAMRAQSLRVKAPGIFDPDQSGDVDVERWVRKHKAALREDRLKL